MPPSPAMRCSLGRELKGDNHKRGRSLEGPTVFREKDDDLTMFNEMQTKEKQHFLLQSNDDFEDTFSSRLRYFSECKLGVSIPARGESSELLNEDGEKNDYDWLLTPPDTPLFPSLDDETPSVTLTQRGRPRSQPITISRSSTMEKSQRSSASPNHLSPSPCSGNNSYQSRGRPFSAPHRSPTNSLRQDSPSRRQSPPPNKPSSPLPRSSTPTARGTAGGSGGKVSPSGSGIRSASPVKTSRGNSASPKIRAWQTNIPGFSLEAPPNLRTSISDRPPSFARGSSPASRNGKGSSSRSGRQSMSPTPSRSVSSSHSHDREPSSTHSKGSVASSGDEDVDSLQSMHVGSSDYSRTRRVITFGNNKSPTLSKKTSRTVLSSSTPKRSFDSALRQDHKKGPQNMFRPLLSSVPSSTFYAGKTNISSHATASRNSPVATSSNTSSHLGMFGPHETKSSNHNQDDVAREFEKVAYGGTHEDLFAFDEGDDLNEDVFDSRSHVGQRLHFSVHTEESSEITDADNVNILKTSLDSAAASELFEFEDTCEELEFVDIILCSICGNRYSLVDLTDSEVKICRDCWKGNEAIKNFDKSRLLEEIELLEAVTQPSKETHVAQVKDEQSSSLKSNQNLAFENSNVRTLKEDEQMFENEPPINKPITGYDHPSPIDNGRQNMQHLSDTLNSIGCVSEGSGISILLKRSSSNKGTVFQGRTFAAIGVSYDDPLYVRESSISTRSSIGHVSASASSSMDLGSSRQTEACVQRQMSGKKLDTENYRHEISRKHQRTGSSMSGASASLSVLSCLDVSTSTCRENFDGVSISHPEDKVECDNLCGNLGGDCTKASDIDADNSISYPNDGESKKVVRTEDQEECIPVDFNELNNSILREVDIEDVETTQNSSDSDSTTEVENNGVPDLASSESEVDSPSSKNAAEDIPESVALSPDKDTTASSTETKPLDHSSSIHESTVLLEEGHGQTKMRSLTLEEATEAILFCNSIVQNIANEAANIAIDKERATELEVPLPMLPHLMGPTMNLDRKDPRGQTLGKRGPRSQKQNRKRVQTESRTVPDSPDDGKHVNASATTTTRIVGVVASQTDSMKPPPPKLESKCNCSIM
ncbi:uncharacterized protein LOC124927519 isoform X2 [Impatiens glandulifera]|uniref:uncharacterized protein LOC124927519 isoform X2 n=1 Tax=Impatiens glandulifera TaxID=253017 RepID=UPI001FB0AF48|nr:uncharacterized protein LOC124927519 isoform X2 [Impatiens glandulifera]